MSLLFLGDFLYDYDDIQEDMQKIADWISAGGYKVVLNLEAPITEDFSQKRKKRGPNLNQNKCSIEILKKLQVAGVCLSNNHIMDFGDRGLADTIRLLDENNILHTGAGSNLSEAGKPMVIQDNQETYEIYNFGWYLEETVYAGKRRAGCSPRETDYILRCADKSKKQTYKKIAVMHWGFEYNYLPMPYDIGLAHMVIDAGFDMVIGHHPHVVQPKENYRNKMIFYSIGNFYMGTRRLSFYRRLKNEVLGMGILLHEKEYAQFDVNYNVQGTWMSDSIYKKDITGIDFNSKAYIKRCKSNSQNYTPILTNNRVMNAVKIACLELFYAAYGLVRPFRGNREQKSLK